MVSAGIDPAQGHQGFVTDAGRFVDRKQGMKIAVAADQLLPLPGDAKRSHPELFSEDVW